jgi:hypothetical protein
MSGAPHAPFFFLLPFNTFRSESIFRRLRCNVSPVAPVASRHAVALREGWSAKAERFTDHVRESANVECLESSARLNSSSIEIRSWTSLLSPAFPFLFSHYFLDVHPLG